MHRRTFAQYTSPKPTARVLDVTTTLRHFALVTYTIDPDALNRMLPAWLSPLTVVIDGRPRALVSVVLFVNTRFRSAVFPSPSLNMAQINYRAYVVDHDSGEHAIWFMATFLDSWAFIVPRFVWHMPWTRGRIQLTYECDLSTGLYSRYRVDAASNRANRAPTAVEIAQDADTPLALPGFPDVETGLVCLTHAMSGYYRRRDGRVAVNRVWHEPIPVKPARLVHASFPMLEELKLVQPSEQVNPYSVLIAPSVDFMSRLPPAIVDDAGR